MIMMRHRLIHSAIAVVMLLLFIPGMANGQGIKNRWGAGYRYGFVNAEDDDFNIHGDAHYLNVTYGLTDNIAIECEGGYFRLESKADTKLDVYSFHTDIQLRANTKKLVPYLIGGIGFQVYDYRNIGQDDRKDKEISVSYESGVGVEYFFTGNWALNLEVMYVYGNTGGDATLDVYSWQFGYGLKYYF